MYDLGIINGHVYRNHQYQNINIYIKDGIIQQLSNELLKAKDIYDVEGLNIYPGIIDPHTHFELDLGHIKSKDNFKEGSKAAIFGGVTTIIDFLAPVDNKDDLISEMHSRTNQAKDSFIDYKFHACFKNPKGNVLELVETLPFLGLDTVKIFTTYSDSNRRTYYNEIKELLELTKTHDFLVTAHIENDEMIDLNSDFTYKDLPISRPTLSETSEALELAELVKETNGYLYMVHCSSGETLKKLKEEYHDILNSHFFIESCPHYFTFSNDVFNQTKGYLYTMAPPLRSSKEVTLLNNYIDDVYTIGTDHCTFDEAQKKKKRLKETPLGVGGVEYSFDVMFARFGEKVIDKMTLNVAKAHKLYPQKGIIEVGSDADLFVYQLKDRILTENHSATDHFIYKDLPVKGHVKSTISRGQFLLKDRQLIKQQGHLLNKVVTL